MAYSSFKSKQEHLLSHYHILQRKQHQLLSHLSPPPVILHPIAVIKAGGTDSLEAILGKQSNRESGRELAIQSCKLNCWMLRKPIEAREKPYLIARTELDFSDVLKQRRGKRKDMFHTMCESFVPIYLVDNDKEHTLLRCDMIASHPSRTTLKTIHNKNFYGLSSGSVGKGGEDLFKSSQWVQKPHISLDHHSVLPHIHSEEGLFVMDDPRNHNLLIYGVDPRFKFSFLP
ncbi:hypothetical protein QYF36_011468 [Acer negundo]|nr:hypothetical protein QYF36_011468 [Acer negundo]